jgi:hypothetical protein
MSSQPIRGALALVGTVVLLATVTAGCGRRGLPAAGTGPDGGAGSEAAATQPVSEPTTTGATASDSVAGPTEPPAGATESPAAAGQPAPSVEPIPAPTPAPLVAPDLTAIEQLLADLDAALGADVTAETEEGSAP